MPNHVTNRLIIEGSKKKIKEMLDVIKGKDVAIDFEKIIPMPKSVFRGDINKAAEEKYGDNNWYDWSIKNWGTKWNAYDTSLQNDSVLVVLVFNTAWAAPMPVVLALSKKFPDLVFNYSYADEDMGHNLGILAIRKGKIKKELSIKEGSDEALKLACEIKGMDYAEMMEERDQE